MSEASHWATVKQAVELTGRSERTIRRWIKNGKIPVDRTGPGTRVDIAGFMPVMPPQQEALTGEVAALQWEIDRLTGEVARLQADNDRLWQMAQQAQALAMSLAPKALPAPKPRRTVLDWLGFRRGREM